MFNSKFKNILRKIKQYNTIVIARHTSPDPDAVASQIALRDAIKLTFPKKNVYAVGVSVAKFKTYGVLDKIDETILVYFDLGFKIMVLLNGTLSILYQSQIDYAWPFKDTIKIVPDSLITELQYQHLSAAFVMCSRSELRQLIKYNCDGRV